MQRRGPTDRATVYWNPIRYQDHYPEDVTVFIRLLQGDAVDQAMAHWGLAVLRQGSAQERRLCQRVEKAVKANTIPRKPPPPPNPPEAKIGKVL